MIRIADILLSGIALLILMPVLIPISIILKFTGENEIFYRQTRIGAKQIKFSVLKFATMLKDSANMPGGTITIANDPRILPMGSFLRSSKLNELPQLINVFLGDMSLIGPRPLTENNFNFYSDDVKTKISIVRPGLSGIGSIVFRSEETILAGVEDREAIYRDVIAPYKGELESWFVANISLLLYIKLIWLTLRVVVLPSSVDTWSIIPSLPKPSDPFLVKRLHSNVNGN